jgi:hypothetical protein
VNWLVFGIVAPFVGGVLGVLGSVLFYQGSLAPWFEPEMVSIFYFLGLIPAVMAGGIIDYLERNQGTADLWPSLGICGLVGLVWAVVVPIGGLVFRTSEEYIFFFTALGVISGAVCWWLTRWLASLVSGTMD